MPANGLRLSLPLHSQLKTRGSKAGLGAGAKERVKGQNSLLERMKPNLDMIQRACAYNTITWRPHMQPFFVPVYVVRCGGGGRCGLASLKRIMMLYLVMLLLLNGRLCV